MGNPFKITMTKKKGNTQFVGVHFPQAIADYLALYAVYRGISKQTAIQEMIETCISNEIETEHIIVHLTDRALSHWRTMLRENTGKKGWRNDSDEAKKLEEFCTELRRTLQTRGVSKLHINKVLEPLVVKKVK